jgi:DNA-binding SARP family transcriptional activator/tetratricopeptide (TPR) repeat protein
MDGASSSDWMLMLGRQVRLRTPGGEELALDPLAQLIAARLVLDGPQPRESLARRLWPETDTARARGNLRQRLLRLKTQAGRTWIDGGDTLVLAADLRVQRLADEPLLPELPEPADDELAAWLHGARQTWQQPRREALERALAEAEAEARLDDALARATECVALDPTAEQPRRALARVHYLRQDRARALVELDALDELLRRQHGAPPSPATQALRRQVLAQTGAPAPEVLAKTASELPVSLLRPPRLVGRDAEQAQLRQALDGGAACLLLGEAGLGKSRLIDDVLLGRAGAAGVKAQSGDAAVPFATLARLLRRLLADHAEAAPAHALQVLSPLLPGVATAASALLSPGPAVAVLAPEGPRLALLETLRTLWQRLGLRVVAVDDLHFADDASLELLQALIGDERLAGVCWLLAQRPAEPGGASARVDALLNGLAETARLQRLRLQPLDEPGVAALVGSLGLGLDAEAWAPRLHRHTGGNPLFVLETLKQLQRADVAGGRLPASASVEALIERRLQRLGAPALALARLAALAGADFDLPLAEAVAGRGLLDLADAWNELVLAQVLREDGSFAHDLVLDAVRRGVPSPVARELHRRIAGRLAACGAAPARLAEHWERAGASAEAGRAWRAAAQAAAAAGRHREEAVFCGRAAEAFGRCSDHAARFDALCAEVDACVRADLGEESLARAAALAGLAADDAERLRALRLHVDMLANRGQAAQALQQAQPAFALLERLPESALTLAERIRLSACAIGCHMHLMQHDEGGAALDRLLGQVASSGFTPAPAERQLLANAQANVAWISGRLREAVRHYERAADEAEALGRSADAAVCWGNIATSWARLGFSGHATEAAERSLRLHRIGDPGTGLVQQAAINLARARRDQGRFAEALALYEDAVAAFGASRSGVWRLVAELGLATTWSRLGQFARALALLHTDDGEAPAFLRSQRRLARGDLLLLMGGEGRPWLDEAWAVLREIPPYAPGSAVAWLQGQPPAEVWAEAGRIAAEAHAADLGGVALTARVRQAEAALALGREADAESAAAAALALLAEGRHPEGTSLPMVWWVGARAAQAAGLHHEAARRAAAGAHWLRDAALPHVAPPFIESFLTRHPVHRALLALQQALQGGAAAP